MQFWKCHFSKNKIIRFGFICSICTVISRFINLPNYLFCRRSLASTIHSRSLKMVQPTQTPQQNGGANPKEIKPQLKSQKPLQTAVQLAAEKRVRQLWASATAVCFDVDSTVCQDEGIDELASFLNKGQQVAQCTKEAMGGKMSFREALDIRLQIIRPSKAQVQQFTDENPPKLTEGIVELVAELQRRGTKVYLVSGGFKCLIGPVAQRLNISLDNVFANEILFDASGAYLDFDKEQPTSDSGGKAVVCDLLKQRIGHDVLIMVGDGATDLEAAPPADAFIGFGANQQRQAVVQGAHWFVHSFKQLLDELTVPDSY